ncbi:cupredoxin domain-containing protein [Paenibacillus sp. CAU 1782]
MYIVLNLLEQSMLACLLFAVLALASGASKLIFSPSEQHLHRKAVRLHRLAAAAVVPAIAAIAAELAIIMVAQPAIWGDRLLLRAPLAAGAVVLILAKVQPRLRMLIQRTAGQGQHALDLPRRRHATEPALVAASQIAALFATASCYFVVFPPAPFRWLSVLLPLAALLLLSMMVLLGQNGQSRKACLSSDATRYFPWKRRLRITGMISAAFVVISVPVLLAMENSLADSGSSILPDLAASGSASGSSRFLSSDGGNTQGESFDREYKVVLDNRLAFFNGVPSFYDTVNGKVLSHNPLLIVREGELVKTTIVNRSDSELPLQLAGHSMNVVSLNGKDIEQSVDGQHYLELAPGDVCIVAFRADNPEDNADPCGEFFASDSDRTIALHLLYEGRDNLPPRCQPHAS